MTNNSASNKIGRQGTEEQFNHELGRTESADSVQRVHPTGDTQQFGGDRSTLAELRRDLVAAACMLGVITLGAFLIMTVIG
jgi:hypothetical protein